MQLIELIKKNRSYRRFDANFKIVEKDLVHFIEHARLSASARNQQSLKYILVLSENKKNELFPTLKWAGYLKDWDGPAVHQRPSAYIIVCNDTSIASNHFCDEGIAMQSILLAAAEKELGGCIIAAFDKNAVRNMFEIPTNFDILNVLAIGKPDETVVIDKLAGDNVEYYRDGDNIHHVPKRGITEIIHKTH